MAGSGKTKGSRIRISERGVVYTPPDYNTSGKNYPVVYLLHGLNDYERGWTQSGMANNIMDNLIAEGKAVPAIVVMPFGHATTGATGKQPETIALQKSLGYTPPAPAAGGGGRGVGIGGAPGWNMEKEMIEYVIPYIEKEFRVIKDKEHRAIMGYSMGGGHSTSIGFGHPELFSYVGGFSGYGSDNLLTADPEKTNKNYKMLFFGSGTEDTAVVNGRRIHTTLTEKNIKHIWSEDPGFGHDYQVWRIYFHRLMQQTFRD